MKKKEEEENSQRNASEIDKKVSPFPKSENSIVSNPMDGFKSDAAGPPSISNMAAGEDKVLPSFWIPSMTPSAEKSILEKPDPIIHCPISQKLLKVKDLIDVKFTPVNDPYEKKSIHTRENRYMLCGYL
ncbi:hypothetical protein JTB14_014482 [Gonioctena quinquepunctata]|nr:hypothetical protein JTB14_014482 [Gonioctena quinquepunctata]